jgi:hypothetical protein
MLFMYYDKDEARKQLYQKLGILPVLVSKELTVELRVPQVTPPEAEAMPPVTISPVSPVTPPLFPKEQLTEELPDKHFITTPEKTFIEEETLELMTSREPVLPQIAPAPVAVEVTPPPPATVPPPAILPPAAEIPARFPLPPAAPPAEAMAPVTAPAAEIPVLPPPPAAPPAEAMAPVTVPCPECPPCPPPLPCPPCPPSPCPPVVLTCPVTVTAPPERPFAEFITQAADVQQITKKPPEVPPAVTPAPAPLFAPPMAPLEEIKKPNLAQIAMLLLAGVAIYVVVDTVRERIETERKLREQEEKERMKLEKEALEKEAGV